MELGLAGVLAALFVLAFVRDPRTMRCALLLLGALSALLVRLTSEILAAIAEHSDRAAGWALLGLLIVLGLLLLVVAVMLVLNGVTMLRREGRRLANLLSLGLGGVILAAIAAGAVVLATPSPQLVVLMLAACLPAGFLAFGFVAYLVYSPLYQAHARGMRRAPEAIVVLGSGLIRGLVPPLLAGRLDRAREVYESVLAAGRRPLVVTSGGQGPDEPRAEAVAMAEYLTERGLPPEEILIEDESRTTDENLANTAALLAGRGITGPVAVVTNDYHAFRSAMVMRRLGLPGHAFGSPTADYYWPSASIREYLAILRDHLGFVVSGLVLVSVPVVAVLAAPALAG